MWQRFSELARKVFSYAQEHAQRVGSPNVDNSHLLLGLLREESCRAYTILDALAVNVSLLRDRVNALIEPGTAAPSAEMTLTLSAKRTVDSAYAEARDLHNNFIGTEHLLLGVIGDTNSPLGLLLAEMNVTVERARAATVVVQDGQEIEPSENEPVRRSPPQSVYSPEVRKLLQMAVEAAELDNIGTVTLDHIRAALKKLEEN